MTTVGWLITFIMFLIGASGEMGGLFFIIFGVLAVVVPKKMAVLRRKKKLPNIAQENSLPTSSWKAIHL